MGKPVKEIILSSVSLPEGAMYDGDAESMADSPREGAEEVQENCMFFCTMHIMTNAKLGF